MAALFSRILLIPIQIITFFWAKNYFGLISAWVAETEQMSGPKGDEFDMWILEGFWRQFRTSFKSHKPVSKTYRPKNDIFDLLEAFSFPF